MDGANRKTRRQMFEEALAYEGKLRQTAILLLDYIDLLGAELEETAPIAHDHGWRSSRVEEGKRIRAALGIKDSDLERTR